MTAYIQREINGDFPNINFAIANDGFRKMGWEIINYYGADQITDIKKEDLFVGFVHETKQVLQSLKVSVPEISCYPESLAPYYGRKLWKSTLRKLINDDAFGVFIKPVENKLFTGKLVRSFRDLISIGHQQDDVNIWCSEPLDIVTECRCFVRNGDIVDIRNYKGSWKSRPDIRVIEAAVSDFTEALDGYAIDLGITRSGKTVVIEVNDGYALGSYGLFSIDYCKLLNARWTQIVGTDDLLMA